MKLILPLFITLPHKKIKDKIWYLNLNLYRNANFHILNQAKELYKDVVKDALENATDVEIGEPPYHFIYTVYPASNRKFDLANVLPIVQKFTDDALIELGIITDDSYKVIPNIDYCFGYVDKENPRVELEII